MSGSLLARFAPPLALAALALLGPPLAGTAEPPSFAPSAAQLLPPGKIVQEVRLEGGGFLRAEEVRPGAGGTVVRTRDGSRTLSGVRADGPVRRVRLWLGTDHQGRSLLALLVEGARTSLVVAATATLVALLLGTLFGLGASFVSPAVRTSLEVTTDALLGLPRLVLLLMLGLMLRGSPAGMGLAIGLASWMEISRLVQGEALKIRAEAFVVAAEATGAGHLRVAWKHVLPNLSPILTVSAPLVATQAILLEATLSFLGVAGSGEWASWGRVIADGHRLLPDAWWIVVFPGLLLCGAALAIHGLVQGEEQRARRGLGP